MDKPGIWVGKWSRETKCCTRCGEEKPATREYFYTNRATYDQLTQYCIPCCKTLSQEWRDKNPERKAEYDREWIAANSERKKETRAAWAQEHKGRLAELHRERRKRRKQARENG